MSVAQALLAFVVAAGLLTLAPGVDTALVLRTAATGGPRRAAFAALGIGLGLMAWGAAAAAGLAALLAASSTAFTVLKWAGAAYLVWMGLQLLRRPGGALVDADAPADHGSALAALRRGLVTNLLNPKVGVFYVTFLPQFTPPGVAVGPFALLLAAIHVGLGMIWFAALIAATVPLGGWLRRAGVVRALNRLTGGVFIGFGVKLALTR